MSATIGSSYFRHTFFLCMFLFFPLSNFSGFSVGTLVKGEHHLIPSQELSKGHSVVAWQKNDALRICPVVWTGSYRMSRFVRIILDEDTIDATMSQKYYVCGLDIFKAASELKRGDCLLTSAGVSIPIRDIIFIEENKDFFDITVDECHTYFVSRKEILVHNVAPLALGLLSVAANSAIKCLGTSLATCMAGAFIGFKMHKGSNASLKNKSNVEEYGVSCGGAPFDPDEFKKQHPHGKYVDAPYHHENSGGRKSKAPKNGQSALDNSVQFSQDSFNRVGISENEFVVLNRTQVGEYHGYVVEWQYLTDNMKKVLIKNKMVSMRGKIICMN